MKTGRVKKTIVTIVVWCAILLGTGAAIYFLNPEVKKNVGYTIVSHKIEKKLEAKYGIPFEVKTKWIGEGNQLFFYPVRYPKQEAAYSFLAIFQKDASENESYIIAGIVDYETNILADSYAYYLYEDDMLRALLDTVSEVIPSENILAVNFMNPRQVITLSEDADSWETFFEHTQTYEPMCLLINENCSSEQIQAVKSALTEAKFPFSVLISKISAEEMYVLRENNIKSLLNEYGEVITLMDELYKETKYVNHWIDNLEEYGEYYLWYENEENLYNADAFDKIIRDVE